MAYRPSRQETGDQIEIWPFALRVGEPLPKVPLALRGIATIPMDLEGTYEVTCLACRLEP